MDIDQIGRWLLNGKTTISAEITSPGFFLQLGLILIGAGLAFAGWTAIRSRYHTSSTAMGWPNAARRLVRVLIESGDADRRWTTVGVSHNVIEASYHALVDSVDYKLHRSRRPAVRRKRGAEAVRTPG